MIGVPGGIAIVGAPGATTTFNPADKSAHITLSGGNLIATGDGAGGGDDLVRSTTSKTVGKLYFEGNLTTGGTEFAIGLANSTATLTAFLGTDNNGIGIFKSGHIFRNGSNVLSGPAFANGDIVGVAIDFPNNLIWFRNNTAPTVWNAGGTADPATGVGGLSIAAITGPFFICFDNPGSPVTTSAVNPGNSFNAAAPSGYSAWG